MTHPRTSGLATDTSASPASLETKDQTAIWRHFQTHEAGVFDRNKPRLDALVAEIRRHCGNTDGALVVNVGPGNGYLEARCRDVGLRVVSIDPDVDTVALMQARGHEAHVAYLDHLPFNDASVHCLVASEVLEHVPPDALVSSLSEVRRVLTPGGRFIGTVPNEERLEDNLVVCPHCTERFHRWGHQQSFSTTTLRQHLAVVGQVERIRVQSFVDWSRRSPLGLAKTLLRWVFGRMGLSIASPNLRFTVRR